MDDFVLGRVVLESKGLSALEFFGSVLFNNLMIEMNVFDSKGNRSINKTDDFNTFSPGDVYEILLNKIGNIKNKNGGLKK